MPDHPPTQPAPMSEDELKDFEQRAVKERNAAMREIVPISRWTFALWLDDFLGVVAEVRRLQAENARLQGEGFCAVCEHCGLRKEFATEAECDAFGYKHMVECTERGGSYRIKQTLAELTAVRAAVTEEGKRADRAEAAARELREKLMVVGGESLIKYQPEIEALLASTAWLTGGNEQPITEEGKGNGK